MISPVKLLLASALTATVVNGHGWMTKPAATFSASAGDKTQFIATIDSSTSGLKGTFNTAPADNVASYTKAFKTSSYKSLKALIDDKAKITVTGATLTCGTAEPDAAAQPLPATVEWSHSDSEGFTPSHEGPCEVWCDDTMAFHDDNCAANFKAAPAELPYEKSKCSGASKLTFYWMAMHGPSWQVYVNCATLSGGSGGGTTQSSGSSATTTDSSSAGSPAAQTPSSGGSPSTPSSGGSPSTPTTDSSSADTPSVTPAPASGGSPSTQTTPAPASGGSPSTSTTPSSNTSPSTSTTTAPSTPTTDESDCGSYDVAGGSGDEGKDNGTPTTGGNTYQQGGNTGTETNTDSNTNQGSNTGTNQWTNTDSNTNQGSNTGTNQWMKTGTNTNQWSNPGGNTEQQWTNTGTQNTGMQQNTYQNTGTQQNTGTGSQNSYSFNTFQGNPNTGTVAPQNM